MATPRQGFETWPAGILQADVPANDNVRRLDATVNLAVLSDSIDAQPVSPALGDAYLITAAPTGADWAGKAVGTIAYYDGAWFFVPPVDGMTLLVADTGATFVRQSGAWVRTGPPAQANETAGRALNTTYTNTSARSIMVSATVRCAITVAAGNAHVQAKSDAATPPVTIASGIVGIESGLLGEDNTFQVSFVVAAGMKYRIDSVLTNGTATLGQWFEVAL